MKLSSGKDIDSLHRSRDDVTTNADRKVGAEEAPSSAARWLRLPRRMLLAKARRCRPS